MYVWGEKFKILCHFWEGCSLLPEQVLTSRKWSLVRQMWLLINKGLEDQDCCAVPSLLVETNVERMKN